MSSSTDTLISSTFPPTPTRGPGGFNGGSGNRDGDNNGGRDSRGRDRGNNDFAGSIYLYAFLGVLFLLLLVSTIVLLRTRALRQRHRREVAEAIRNGTYIPPPDFKWSADPVMFDAWVEKGRREVDARWEDIKPVSASLYSTESKINDSNQKTRTQTLQNIGNTSSTATSVLSRLRQAFARPRNSGFTMPTFTSRSPPSTAAFDAELLVLNSDPKVGAQAPLHLEHVASAQAVRVSVLIAMPMPTEVRLETWELSVPYVEVGSVDVDVGVDAATAAGNLNTK
ncbi:hypothetical protein V5O48_019001 [Marasmius crinis-equi]|uniref:Uncharacterized protein n=1 Tax=Marasmius crinis-equi TaxID=585013 RepID=A0ABR3EJL8_9AGAR